MIESNLLCSGVCIDEHIFSAVLDTVRVPEVMRVSYPMSRAGNVDDEITRLGLKIMPALVVGERALRVQRNSGGNGYQQVQYRTVTVRHRRESPLAGAISGTEFFVSESMVQISNRPWPHGVAQTPASVGGTPRVDGNAAAGVSASHSSTATAA